MNTSTAQSMDARSRRDPARERGRSASIGRLPARVLSLGKDLFSVHWANGRTVYWNIVIVLAAALMIGALWLAAGTLAEDELKEAEESATRQNDNLAIALEEQTVRVLKSSEQVISQVLRDYRVKGARLDIEGIVNEGGIDKRIFHNIGVLDASGRMVAGYRVVLGMDFSDRPVFSAHRGHSSDEVYVGVPIRGRPSNEWVIPVSRHITLPDGSFGGVIYVGVDPHYFTDFYQRADLGKNGVVNLVGVDGYTRARRSGDKGTFGQDRRGSLLAKEQAKAPVGHFITRGQQESVRRYQSYRTLADYPLIVAVGTSVDEALADYRERKHAYNVAAGMGTAFILGFVVLLLGALVNQARARQQIELKSSILSTQLETSLDSILLVDWDGKILSYNQRFLDFWGVSPALVQGGEDEPVLKLVLEKVEDPEAFLARVKYLYEHRAEKSKDEIRLKDGRIVERYSAPVIGSRAEYLGRVWYFRDVTMLVTSMSELRASEARFQRMAETIGEVFWMAPPDLSAINYVSPAFEKIWGRPCADLYARPLLWLEAIDADDKEMVSLAAERLAAGRPYDIEYRIHRPDGVVRWIHDRGYPMCDAAGKVILTSGIASDITEAKRAEIEVRLEQQQRQAILDSIPDMAWLKDSDSRFLAVNEALAKTAGMPAAELIGKADADFLPAGVADRYRTDDIEVMRTGECKRIDESILDATGRSRQIETIKTRVCDANGNVIGTAGIARDITERRMVEEQLRLSAKAFDSITDGVTVTDSRQQIVSVNPAFTRITGYSAEELIGRTPAVLRSGRQDSAFYSEMWKEINETGHWKGEIWDRRKNGEVYPALLRISQVRDPSGALTHYVGVCTDISSLKRYEAELDHQVHHDALTGLANRVLFHERAGDTLARAKRHQQQAAVLFLDLDRFKNVNDSLGHDVGDGLLKAVAVRLAGSVRESDTVARFGGDEFAVLLEEINDNQGAAAVARKLLEAMAAPFQLGEHQVYVSVSIGIGCYPQDGGDLETLFKCADTAMYRAKAEGRNNYQFFSAEMNAKALENLVISNNLRLALERDELLLHFQPQFDIQSARPVAAEALVRWRHPELGMIPPARFIPVAEDNGFIDAIGAWVLKAACWQMRRWRDDGVGIERVAVNVSARQLRNPNFVEQVTQILADTCLHARYLELEVTESALMENPQRAVAILARLKEMGIAIAIDDFGTGYSSLAYLKRLPLTALKLDKSFVDGLPSNSEDASISRAIVSMAHRLGLRVIAEGVENRDQLKFLEFNQCDEVQGYLLSKPVPAGEIAQIFSKSEVSASVAA